MQCACSWMTLLVMSGSDLESRQYPDTVPPPPACLIRYTIPSPTQHKLACPQTHVGLLFCRHSDREIEGEK